MTIQTYSARETIELGKRFSSFLQEKDVVVLEGTLGGGKTTFIKGIVKGLGCRQKVLSPSFTLLRCYTSKKFDIYHLDLYRLETQPDLAALGMEDFLYACSSLTLIEWGEKSEHLLPKYIKIIFSYAGENSRTIAFSYKGYGKREFQVKNNQ